MWVFFFNNLFFGILSGKSFKIQSVLWNIFLQYCSDKRKIPQENRCTNSVAKYRISSIILDSKEQPEGRRCRIVCTTIFGALWKYGLSIGHKRTYLFNIYLVKNLKWESICNRKYKLDNNQKAEIFCFKYLQYGKVFYTESNCYLWLPWRKVRKCTLTRSFFSAERFSVILLTVSL
jgi:hypothetical protein